MISKKHNCIFIHIPKTGGTSIENMIWAPEEKIKENLYGGGGGLNEPFIKKLLKPRANKHQTGGLQHLLAKQVKKEVNNKFFAQALKFTMVRNPWDKVISQYKYMFTKNSLMKYIGMDKNTKLIQYLELISKKKHVQWEDQHKFFLDDNGETIVNHILKFENFNMEVSKILNKLDIEFDAILHLNKGIRKHYSEYYDNETKEFVADMYSQDIKLLGYSYNSMTKQ